MRDEAAFIEFAGSARDRLRRTAYLLCGDWDRASDLVQEGLIRVYVRWPRLVRRGGELAYARKAVVSAYLDQVRRRSSTERPQEADHTVASSEDVATAVSTRLREQGCDRPSRRGRPLTRPVRPGRAVAPGSGR